jgi:hypothetical protein
MPTLLPIYLFKLKKIADKKIAEKNTNKSNQSGFCIQCLKKN